MHFLFNSDFFCFTILFKKMYNPDYILDSSLVEKSSTLKPTHGIIHTDANEASDHVHTASTHIMYMYAFIMDLYIYLDNGQNHLTMKPKQKW